MASAGRRGAALALGFALAAGPAAAVELEHKAPDCVLANAQPKIVLKATPDADVARIRLHFRSRGEGGWYSVPVQRIAEGVYQGALPQPKASLPSFQYYLEAADVNFDLAKTPEHSVRVVRTPKDCGGGRVADVATPTELLISAPSGYKVPKVPPGFSSSDTTRAGEEHVGVFNLSSGQALIGAGALLAGGVVVGLKTANKPTPAADVTIFDQFPPSISVTFVFPAVGGSISARNPAFSINLQVIAPEPVANPIAHVDFYQGQASSSPICAVFEQRTPNVSKQLPALLPLRGNLTLTGACGEAPFTVGQARVSLRNSSNGVVLETGSGFPDVILNYTVTP